MRYLFAAPLLAAIPGIAFAGPLTFEAALQRARQEAPSLKAKVLGADAARSARGAAGPLPDPTLGVSVESFPISGPLAFEPQRDDFTMARVGVRSEEHTSELQSLMRISYAVFCLKKKKMEVTISRLLVATLTTRFTVSHRQTTDTFK